MSDFHLHDYDISVRNIGRNLPPSRLYEEAIRHEADSRIAASGALVAYSGSKTGRSPNRRT